MKSIPTRPKMTKEETELVQEQFMRGNRLPDIKQINDKSKRAKNTGGKNGVKMYNLPLPIEVHAKAKMLALMEGKSLADYIISAVKKANEEMANKYNGI
ncbi:MAG: hypothetical protein DBY32_09320 [Phascolarctobacterium sp.]|nr:MAG: hypothetical protein DBY32_09320 [Phascolarctobacterium sp.]